MMGMEMAHRDQRELSSEEEVVGGDLRRGPWTVDEDLLLVNYIAAHGEGRWNVLARCAGLRRTGKSCRLRWLNYLRPDLRRGNITAQEQLLILELHSRWGNRWSKIAQHLPGRTDNEIKNYWRTRVQKHAKQLKCDVNSQQFKDLMRYLWMPRLLERIHSSATDDAMDVHQTPPPSSSSLLPAAPVDDVVDLSPAADVELSCTTAVSSSSVSTDGGVHFVSPPPPPVSTSESAPGSNNDGLSYSNNTTAMYGTVCQQPPHSVLVTQDQQPWSQFGAETCSWSESLPGLAGLYADIGLPDLEIGGGGVLGETMWGTGADDLWYRQMLGL